MGDQADLSVVYSGAVDDVLAAADASPQPQSLDVIYDLALAAGIDSDSVVVDAGCATGDRGRELILRTGCRVDGVELLPQLIEWGTAATEAAGVADAMRFQQGSILDLPIPDGYADLVLCTDVLGLIDDLPQAVAECARVLKPGAAMVVHVTVATVRMAPFEQAELDASQGTVAASMHRATLERALAQHFTIEQAVDLGSQHRLQAIESGNNESLTNLVRAARLMTWPDMYRTGHGDLAYRTALTEALWGVYQLLGKLSPVVYLLRRSPT
jgi:ubiquinone/menaquinone biosynthesis C-methylase UbiE